MVGEATRGWLLPEMNLLLCRLHGHLCSHADLDLQHLVPFEKEISMFNVPCQAHQSP